MFPRTATVSDTGMDFSSPLAVARALTPKLPYILGAATWHCLGYSENSDKWDLRTELIVKLVRAFFEDPKLTISSVQRNSLKDPGISGPVWIAKVTFPAPPESAALDALRGAIDALQTDGEARYDLPELRAVEAEWTGHRAGAGRKASRPDLASEAEHYAALMREVHSDVTVLYLHGGALYLMDPASHRPTCAKLARLTGGRCLSVRYRLAPQHPFPAALLDCFVAYLALLSPPPGALHEAVPAKNIVFAGDSAGGNLSFALLQLLLQLQRASPNTTPTVRFHGRAVAVPLPAGVAAMSPWLDLTLSTPSYQRNARWDYLPPPRDPRTYPSCPAWPTDPPRADLYAEAGTLGHPLASPLAARDWAGAPPLFVACGQELLADEAAAVARRAARQGAAVRWLQLEAMPHCAGLVLPGGAVARRSYAAWSGFIGAVVRGEAVRTEGAWLEAKTLRERRGDVRELAPELADEEVARRMQAAVRARLEELPGGAQPKARL